MRKSVIIFITTIILLYQSSSLANELNFNNVEQKGIILYEQNSDKILFSENGDMSFYPASTTKLMTAIIALENSNLDDTITIGDEVTLLPIDSSKAKLTPGEQIIMEDLLRALLIPSGNDAALSIAAFIGQKSKDSKVSNEKAILDFINLMNQKSKEIGASNTNFMNPHGLHSENHYTTPMDMLLITKEALKYEIIKEIVSTISYELITNKATHKWVNTNVFLHEKWETIPYVSYKGNNPFYSTLVTGVKTGFTTPAGRCVVLTANNGNLDLIAIIFHSTFDEIWSEGEELLNYAFDNYRYKQLNDIQFELLEIQNNSYKSQGQLPIYAENSINYLIKVGNEEKIKEIIEYDKELIYFEKNMVKITKDLEKGTKVGKVTYIIDDLKIGETDLYVGNYIKKENYIDLIMENWTLILAIVFIIIVSYVSIRKRT